MGEEAATKEWTIMDCTSRGGGYLQLQYMGQRVADFFPFARGVDESLIRQQADLVATTMNEAEELRRLAADNRVSSELIGIRIRSTFSQHSGV